jgi:chaperonin GroEL
MFCTTETAVVEKPADEDEHAGHHHGTLVISNA